MLRLHTFAAMRRGQLLLRHTRRRLSHILRILLLLQLLTPALVVSTLPVIREGLGIGEVLSSLDAEELSPPGKFVVVVEFASRDAGLYRFLDFGLYLIRVLRTMAQPYLPLVLFDLAPRSLPSIAHSTSHIR
jgi:hypothetical protein